MDAYFSKTVSSSLEAIPPLAEEIEAWGAKAHIDMQTIFQINLILEELMTNIICYGHQQQPEKKIELTVYRNHPHQLVITLVDEAPAFNPLFQESASINDNIDERAIGGLGIHFVRSLTDHIDYLYTGRGNQLTLYKSL
jgi:anti-sigma regulatory factor (Ser/Thr protein kinase)